MNYKLQCFFYGFSYSLNSDSALTLTGGFDSGSFFALSGGLICIQQKAFVNASLIHGARDSQRNSVLSSALVNCASHAVTAVNGSAARLRPAERPLFSGRL